MFGYNNYPAYQMQANQNRINDLQQQQYGTYQPYQMQQVQPQQNQIIKGRPVSSYEEAKASMIDLDGSLFVFPDIANKRIYTKQIMLDGTADFRVYSLVPEQNNVHQTEGNTNSNEYVLKKDFDNTVSQLLKQIESLKGGMTNEWESTGNVESSNEK